MNKGAPQVGDIIDFHGVRIVGAKEQLSFGACGAGAGKPAPGSSLRLGLRLGLNVPNAPARARGWERSPPGARTCFLKGLTHSRGSNGIP